MKTEMEIIKSHLTCCCDEMYKNRKMVDPNCVLCEYGTEIELMMQEYAAQKQPQVSDEEIEKEKNNYLEEVRGMPKDRSVAFDAGAKWMRDKLQNTNK